MGRFKKGQSGNPNGRPRGSRNKTSIIKAQLSVDDAMPAVARMYTAIVNRDETLLAEFGLAPKDVTVKLMIDAGDKLIKMGWVKNAVLEPDKVAEKTPVSEQPGSGKPTFTTVAKISQKTA